MKLVYVMNLNKLNFVCCKCNRITQDVYADLNGKSFQDYYCEDCKKELNERRD